MTKLELPPQPAKDARATMDTTAQDVDTELLGRRPDAGHYHVFPRDGTDRKQCNETEGFPKSIPQRGIRQPRVHHDEVRFWVVNITASEVQKAQENAGVKSVEANLEFEPDFILPAIPQPSPVAMASGANKPRSPQYTNVSNIPWCMLATVHTG